VLTLQQGHYGRHIVHVTALQHRQHSKMTADKWRGGQMQCESGGAA
jgi:hypothetical protein